MKKFLVAGLLCVSAPAMADSVWNSPADVDAVVAAVQNSKVPGNNVGIENRFSPDAVVLNYTTGDIYEGRDEIKKASVASRRPFGAISSTVREHSVLTNGNFACALTTIDYQFSTKDAGPVTIGLRQMDVLKKNDGKWEVIQEHLSAPMDPKTGMGTTSNLQLRGTSNAPEHLWASQRVSVEQAKDELKTWSYDSFLALPVDALMDYYGPGPNDIVSYAPVTPGNIRGKVALKEFLTQALVDTASLEISVPLIKIDTDGELGAQIDVQFIKTNFKSGKPSETTYWRQSDCLRKVSGKWYGVMPMASFPVDSKTGKSVVLVTTIPENLKTGK